MYAGQIIQYIVTPVLGIRTKWVTEITHVVDQEYFVDEQRFGPYALWHHEHHFEEVEDGVLMKDQLHYAIPFGPIGRFTNALFVGSKVEEIFNFRYNAIEKLFGKREMVG